MKTIEWIMIINFALLVGWGFWIIEQEEECFTDTCVEAALDCRY